MSDIYVLTWHHSDGSGFGVIAAYRTREEAQAQYDTWAPYTHVQLQIHPAVLRDDGE